MENLRSRHWFTERIGKRVFRDYECMCSDCREGAENGILIHDENHAKYMHMIQVDYYNDGDINLNYRDTK